MGVALLELGRYAHGGAGTGAGAGAGVGVGADSCRQVGHVSPLHLPSPLRLCTGRESSPGRTERRTPIIFGGAGAGQWEKTRLCAEGFGFEPRRAHFTEEGLWELGGPTGISWRNWFWSSPGRGARYVEKPGGARHSE